MCKCRRGEARHGTGGCNVARDTGRLWRAQQLQLQSPVAPPFPNDDPPSGRSWFNDFYCQQIASAMLLRRESHWRVAIPRSQVAVARSFFSDSPRELSYCSASFGSFPVELPAAVVSIGTIPICKFSLIFIVAFQYWWWQGRQQFHCSLLNFHVKQFDISIAKQ